MNKTLKKLRFLLTRSEKKRLAILFMGTLILASMELFSIGIIIPIMNLFVDQEKIYSSKVLQWGYQLTGVRDATAFLALLIIIATGLFISKSLFSVCMLYSQRRFVDDVDVRLTTGLLRSYLNKPYSFHLENNSAILFRNLTTVVSQFSGSFLFPLVLICAEITILLAIFSLLIGLYPLITLLLSGVVAAVVMAINFFLKNRIEEFSTQRLKSGEQINKFGLEALQAVKEIKVYNAQSFFTERYSQVAKRHADTHVKFNVASVLPRHTLEIVLWVSVFTTLFLSLYFRRAPAELIPTMTALGVASLRVLPSVHRIYTYGNSVKYYSNVLDRIYGILKEDSSNEMSEEIIPGDVGMQEPQDIRLEKVGFQYRTAPSSIFDEFSLVIPKYKTVAFAGQTGAGKSTLVDILMGLLIPTNGVLYYGQVAITPQNVSAYRKKIGYVPQQIFLVDDTLEANIAFGIPQGHIDNGRLGAAIKISQLEPLVNELPAGIKTIVGERGTRLSGGQRQRVAIARALYHNPQILIMDEATSSLDGYTEAEVNKAIRNLCGRMTVILIAHRLTTIEYADIIYVMDRGRVVDGGTFKELLENSTAFQRIANQIAA